MSGSKVTVQVVTPRGAGGVAVIAGQGQGRVALATLLATTQEHAGFAVPRRVSLRDPRTGDLIDDGLAVDNPATGALELHCHGSEAVLAAIELALRNEGVALEDGLPQEVAGRLACAARDPLGLALALEQQALRATGGVCPACDSLLGDGSAPEHDEAERFTQWSAGACPGMQWAQGDSGATAQAMGQAFDLRSRVALSHFELCPLVLCGMQNAGKSTLLNRLLFDERALSSAIPGTTRDAVAEEVSLGGYGYLLEDTAGFGPVQSRADARAQARSRAVVDRWMESAPGPVLVWLVDRSVGPTGEDQRLLDAVEGFRSGDGGAKQPKVLVCATKADLAPAPWPDSVTPPDLVVDALAADAAESVRAAFGTLLAARRQLPTAGPVGGCAALTRDEQASHRDVES